MREGEACAGPAVGTAVAGVLGSPVAHLRWGVLVGFHTAGSTGTPSGVRMRHVRKTRLRFQVKNFASSRAGEGELPPWNVTWLLLVATSLLLERVRRPRGEQCRCRSYPGRRDHGLLGHTALPGLCSAAC